MDGDMLPTGLFAQVPAVSNLFENHLTVQFNHRLIAYVLTAVVIWHVVRLMRSQAPASARLTAFLLVGAILGQGLLGIVTLINAVPLPLGAAHQLGAVLVLGLAITHLHFMRYPSAVSAR